MYVSCGFFVLNILGSNALTGHVCSRQKAETYQTTYDRAFICPERYTTSCGQLDWRRCTKYRVNTCYTPTEKYAVRYQTIEECCPGWRDAGSGHCSVPVCEGRCLNGGICSARDGVPACACTDGFTGGNCQDSSSSLLSWGTKYVVIATCIAILGAVAITFFCILRKTKIRSRSADVRLSRLDNEHKEKLLQAEEEDMPKGGIEKSCILHSTPDLTKGDVKELRRNPSTADITKCGVNQSRSTPSAPVMPICGVKESTFSTSYD